MRWLSSQGTCCQAWWPKFDTLDTHDTRWELTPKCFPLTSTCVPCAHKERQCKNSREKYIKYTKFYTTGSQKRLYSNITTHEHSSPIHMRMQKWHFQWAQDLCTGPNIPQMNLAPLPSPFSWECTSSVYCLFLHVTWFPFCKRRIWKHKWRVVRKFLSHCFQLKDSNINNDSEKFRNSL